MEEQKILVAEDEEIVSQVITAMLQRLGYQVVLAKDGAEAIDRFHDHSKDFLLVLFDYNMPKLNGLECIRQIRQSSSIPVILSSGFGDSVSDEEMEEYKINFLLQKPYTITNVQQAIEKAFENNYK